MEPNDQLDGSVASHTAKYSGVSGNEMYCLALLGYSPGSLIIGNSVFSMGIMGGIGSNIRSFVGGEINQITNMVIEGRKLSLSRFSQELAQYNGSGATSVNSELIMHPGNIEFLTIGSCISRNDGNTELSFSSSADGQELFCQWDAGYQPAGFVFGNIAYSIGVAKGLLGGFRQMAKGEVKQYSDIFNKTRNTALERIQDEARKCNANSVIGIKTTILPLASTQVQEMIMIGTASYNPQIESVTSAVDGVVTSDMTAEETWNVTKLGYAPLKLILGTSVYSLGVIGGIKASLKNLVKGEISDLTQLIYGAREQSINKVRQQADEIGADLVIGIKTYIYDLGNGLIEFLAIGTAIKRIDGLATRSEQLPPQAIIKDKDTFINTAGVGYGTDLNEPDNNSASPPANVTETKS